MTEQSVFKGMFIQFRGSYTSYLSLGTYYLPKYIHKLEFITFQNYFRQYIFFLNFNLFFVVTGCQDESGGASCCTSSNKCNIGQ